MEQFLDRSGFKACQFRDVTPGGMLRISEPSELPCQVSWIPVTRRFPVTLRGEARELLATFVALPRLNLS